MKKNLVACTVIVGFAFGQIANADVVIDISEIQVSPGVGDVVAVLSGSLNLDATDGNPVSSTGFNGYQANGGNISFTNDATDAYSIDETFVPFGSGGFGNWDVSAGDPLSLYSDGAIGVGAGYASGSALAGSASAFGETFDSLGFTVGTYVTTLSNGSVSDTVTINIGSTVVPEPASAGLLGLLGLATLTRRRN